MNRCCVILFLTVHSLHMSMYGVCARQNRVYTSTFFSQYTTGSQTHVFTILLYHKLQYSLYILWDLEKLFVGLIFADLDSTIRIYMPYESIFADLIFVHEGQPRKMQKLIPANNTGYTLCRNHGHYISVHGCH